MIDLIKKRDGFIQATTADGGITIYIQSMLQSGWPVDEQRPTVSPHLDEHGSLRLHHHLQQGFDQGLGGRGDQVEEVDDGRADLHLLEGESGGRR